MLEVRDNGEKCPLSETRVVEAMLQVHPGKFYAQKALRPCFLISANGNNQAQTWMASPTRWTWVSVNSGSWWWTGRPGMLRFMGWQRVGHDWATDLIWYTILLGRCQNQLRWLQILLPLGQDTICPLADTFPSFFPQQIFIEHFTSGAVSGTWDKALIQKEMVSVFMEITFE